MKINIITKILVLFSFTIATAQKRDTLCFVQINDIYEISPLRGGKVGGLARLATFIDSCKKRYPTYSFIAGDFLSPSVMGTAVVDGEKLSGKQMVDGLNALGIDYVTFGNHEFDVGEKALRKRINESQFTWISTNVFQQDGTPFYKEDAAIKKPFPSYIEIKSPQKEFNVLLFGLTLPSNTPPYSKFTSYDSALHSLKPTFRALRSKNTLVIGLTHLSAEEDLALLNRHPEIRLSMGGHEHENMFLTSKHKTHVAKADANGKSVYVHLLFRDATNKLTIKSQLVQIDESISLKPSMVEVVTKWEEKAFESFRKSGIEPTRSVCVIADTLNGTEASIRFHQNNMGAAVNRALMTGEGIEASFINSGSIRIDDKVTGSITELDVVRIMPFQNNIVEVELKGSLLSQMIKTNDNRKGWGGYLQYSSNISVNDGVVLLNGIPIQSDRVYKIRTVEFLLTGKEPKLEYFTAKHPEVVRAETILDVNKKPLDLRIVFINTLRN